MHEYRHLSAFPENREVLQTLHQHGVRAGVLSNGDPAMLHLAVLSSGLTAWLDPVLSVHATQRYKPDPATYALGPAALQLPANDILFVSSNAWDALGAHWFGYRTLWVNRGGQPPEQLGAAPDHEARSLRGVLPLLGIAAPPQV